MTTQTVPDTFHAILEQQMLIDRLNHWKYNYPLVEDRVEAADQLKVERRKLYRMFDELEPDEIRAYGEWRSES